MSNDGWVNVSPGRSTRAWNNHPTVTFYQKSSQARLPFIEGAAERGNWQVNKEFPHLLRFVFSAAGNLKATPYGNGTGTRGRQVSKQSLQSALGRSVEGRYPCTIDGFTITIDLSEPLA